MKTNWYERLAADCHAAAKGSTMWQKWSVGSGRPAAQASFLWNYEEKAQQKSLPVMETLSAADGTCRLNIVYFDAYNILIKIIKKISWYKRTTAIPAELLLDAWSCSAERNLNHLSKRKLAMQRCLQGAFGPVAIYSRVCFWILRLKPSERNNMREAEWFVLHAAAKWQWTVSAWGRKAQGSVKTRKNPNEIDCYQNTKWCK